MLGGPGAEKLKGTLERPCGGQNKSPQVVPLLGAGNCQQVTSMAKGHGGYDGAMVLETGEHPGLSVCSDVLSRVLIRGRQEERSQREDGNILHYWPWRGRSSQKLATASEWISPRASRRRAALLTPRREPRETP